MSAVGPPKTAQLKSAWGGSVAAELTNEAASVGVL
jgi:hypothetical protein